MNARTRILLLGLTLALALTAVGCAAPADEPEPTQPDAEAPVTDDAAGLRLAPGLYDMADGTVQALGILEWRDLEGGFWAILSTTGADPAEGTVVAVIPPGSDLDETYKSLEGKMVTVTGTRLEGASIRMAGPEIEVTAIEEISDTPGIAE
jgi:hypothetical protein